MLSNRTNIANFKIVAADSMIVIKLRSANTFALMSNV